MEDLYFLSWKLQRGYVGRTRMLYDEECDALEKFYAHEEGLWRDSMSEYRRMPTADLYALYDKNVPAALVTRLDKEEVVRSADVLRALSALGIEHTVRRGSAIFRCRWHDDAHPSAAFHLEKKLAYCYVCSEGTDLVGFVMRHQNVGFRDALAWLNAWG